MYCIFVRLAGRCIAPGASIDFAGLRGTRRLRLVVRVVVSGAVGAFWFVKLRVPAYARPLYSHAFLLIESTRKED